ncbi:uncharacterized membrane protein HdeD (DUF308 family) [Leucobacter exalbidus]|uniref:Uncharacterized membrane protein HdeD (DUF308 family) n=1 Tax=Leucobacter exalbidus TaxID=662960 RepID=A0A940T2J9_9MICO|nr:uncharacterized membrane protein HdeD (DUF308 family) [Leucobacter exalbidus]
MSIQFPSEFGPEGATQGAARNRRAPRTWIGFLVGALMIVAGIGLVFWPLSSATGLLGILVGTALLVNGIGLMTRGGIALFGGALLAVLGICSFLLPEAIAGALVTFAGIGLLALGAVWITFASRIVGAAVSRAGGRGLGAIAALVPGILLVIGGVIGLVWPELALAVVAVVGGLCVIAVGCLVIWITRKVRRGGPAAQTTIII